MNNDPSDTDRNLCIFFSGDSECITVGKNVIRVLNQPSYIGFRINKDWDSLIIFACNSKDQMSYKVPSKLFEEKRHTVRVYSKAFVYDLIERNELNMNTNYMVPGKYLEDRKVVIFNLKDAITHNNGVIEKITNESGVSDKS